MKLNKYTLVAVKSKIKLMKVELKLNITRRLNDKAEWKLNKSHRKYIEAMKSLEKIAKEI